MAIKCYYRMFFAICILVQLIETVNSECQKKCEFKTEYCDSYTGQCEPCESICSPPNNPKFNECGQNCVPFLQVSIRYYNKSSIIGTYITVILTIPGCVVKDSSPQLLGYFTKFHSWIYQDFYKYNSIISEFDYRDIFLYLVIPIIHDLLYQNMLFKYLIFLFWYAFFLLFYNFRTYFFRIKQRKLIPDSLKLFWWSSLVSQLLL